jgi:hypothetical protein
MHKIMSTENVSNEEKGNGVLADVSKRFYGVGHDEKLCSNPDCVCHTDINKRVATPFPLDTGNPYCCPECALAKHPLTQIYQLNIK